MSMTGLDVFDRTVQETNRWLEELGEELRWEDRREVYHALRATLHVLRDRLPAGEAADLGSQLPMLVQGILYDGWKPTADPTKIRTRDEFLQQISDRMADTRPETDPERVTRAVFGLLSEKISAGEIDDVKHVLPEEIESLWHAPASAER